MLEHFFSEEKADELSHGPMGAYLPRLAVKLIDCDYGKTQGRRILLTAVAYGEWLHQHEITLENAGKSEAEEYAAIVGRNSAGRIRQNSRGLTRVVEYLRPFGVLNRPEPPTLADEWISRFDEYCRRVRGLAVSTRSRYFRFVRLFIARFAGDHEPDWSRLTGHDVAQFAKAELAKVRVLKKTIVTSLRTFLRFLISEGLVARGLLRAIPRIRCWRYANLPEPLTLEQHARVMEAVQSPESGCVRDRAFIALLAQLGVRGCELRHLRLEEIDWQAGTIHIRRTKTGGERKLPLPAVAGELLADYVKNHRPKSIDREVFLRLASPHRPMGTSTPTNLVREFLTRLGFTGQRLGSHCFRHTAATLMVCNGCTLKEVADVLGHKSISTTGIYVKLNQPALQEVAMPWIGAGI
jgi:integrase